MNELHDDPKMVAGPAGAYARRKPERLYAQIRPKTEACRGRASNRRSKELNGAFWSRN